MIAIKDMEMPKSCAECDFRKSDPYSGEVYCSKAIGSNTIIYEKERLENCPLVEIITCNGCKHWHDDGIITTCDKNIGHGFPKDHFCGDGERRE